MKLGSLIQGRPSEDAVKECAGHEIRQNRRSNVELRRREAGHSITVPDWHLFSACNLTHRILFRGEGGEDLKLLNGRDILGRLAIQMRVLSRQFAKNRNIRTREGLSADCVPHHSLGTIGGLDSLARWCVDFSAQVPWLAAKMASRVRAKRAPWPRSRGLSAPQFSRARIPSHQMRMLIEAGCSVEAEKPALLPPRER